MDRDEVEVHKLAKKDQGQYPTILTEQTWSIKDFIWLLGKFFMRDTAGSPEWARWLHLARSGSQSQRTIWFILPARGASHIIKYITGIGQRFLKRHSNCSSNMWLYPFIDLPPFMEGFTLLKAGCNRAVFNCHKIETKQITCQLDYTANLQKLV